MSLLDDVPVIGELISARRWLWERGLAATVSSLTDGSVLASGGVDPGATALRTLIDGQLDVEGERLLGLAGTRLYLDLQLQQGSDGSQDTGDYQVYSNIDGPNRTQLAQVFVEHVVGEGWLRVKVGKSDANTDFAYVDNGLRFIHSSFGYSPTVLGFPTYPDPAFGGVVFVEPGLGPYVGVGVYDGSSQAGLSTGTRGPSTLFDGNGWFEVVEAGTRWDENGLPGRFGVGGWHHTGTFERADGGSETGTSGFYGVLDQQLWRPSGQADETRGVGGFLQYGYADPEVSLVEHYIGVGAEWTGPFSKRPDDACGIGVAWTIWGDRPGHGLSGGGEVALEGFYSFQVASWLSLKPDVQYLHDPGGQPGIADAVVLTLRVAVEF